MVGVDMNEKKQLELLQKTFTQFQSEYNKIPHQSTSNSHTYHFHNLAFDGVDGLVYYAIIRAFKPKIVLEVGSGWSTKIAVQAALLNHNKKNMLVLF